MGKLTRKTCDGLLNAIWQSFYAIKQAGRKRLAELQYDLTLEQIIVLSILEDNDGMNVGGLAEMADKERTTMTRMLDGLERRNLVVRVPDRTDHRQKLVYVTNTGRRRLDELNTLGDEFEELVFRGIDREKTIDVVEFLENLAATLMKE